MGGDGRMPSVLELVFGYTAAKMIDVAARLNLADHLAHGPRTVADLAAVTGAHEQSLYRLLRGLACFGVAEQTGPDTFALGPLGQQLRSDTPDSIRSMVMLLCADETWRSWGELEYSVRSGQPAWDQVNGVSNFEFLAKNPEKAAVFNAAMAEFTRAAAPGIVGRHDFTRYGTIVDIGGGDGSLLAEVLKAAPTTRGTLFDLPAGLAEAAGTLEAAGVADRVTVTAGDFFASVPKGADAYLLKSVLHDWDDEKAAQILRACRRAMATDGVVLAVEPVLPPLVAGPAAVGVVMSDLNMLVNTGGRERTLAEFRALFTAAGLNLVAVSGQDADFCVLEGRVA
ncbi:methyltransferase [Micromonospora echinofusca]|uniref:Methyltransferase n=1 Tax=Micromonospora echinofusca TaxID=47858 RepID=A0ABS3VP05_MICEH|nr:methyltransferase [Micromonospora echinofusca]MBO4206104.1 methyltransferase [Micromonospora echinofusca]